jgi:5'(3')-deoxyribonucleotidase
MSVMKSFLHHINEAPKGEIYCDMDGVLVDIIGGIADFYGIKDLNNKNFDSYVNPLKPRIDKEHPHLFAELPWMKDGKQLWAYISKYNPNILSAHTTSWQPKSKDDKMKWIQKNLRPLPSKSHVLLRDQKKDYAVTKGIPNILIDDWGKNIKEWEARGGIGIKHKSAAETIAALKKLGY